MVKMTLSRDRSIFLDIIFKFKTRIYNSYNRLEWVGAHEHITRVIRVRSRYNNM